ncbi:MAG: hypothetical protein E6K70_13830 [Planctomycetota bacterium]|nr:MAG: hypothetical protein E6K70_13830 [Planctomycetota bacterium]
MEMLRNLRRVCHFPRASVRAALPILLFPVALAILWSAAVFCCAGCTCTDGSFLQPDTEIKPVDATSPAEPPSTPQPEMSIPSVARSQKPEGEAARPAQGGSILDQVSYNVSPPGQSQVAARIRAVVDNVPILDEEVREQIYPYLLATQNDPEPERSQKRAEIFRQELQQIIEREVILHDMFNRLKDRTMILEKLQEAADKEFDKKMRDYRIRMKIDSEEELKAQMRAQGISPEGIRRQISRTFMAMEYMRNLIMPSVDRAVTLEQITEYYQKHPEEFQVEDSVTWQDIFIDASKFPSRDAAHQMAESVVARARQGANFLQLVAQFDNGDSSYRNGEGYGHRHGEIKPPEAEPYLFRMSEGEIGPIVEQANGFHVMRLVKRQVAGLKPFDAKTQKAIKNKLEMQVWEREYKRVLADLKRKASIQISTGTP